MAAAPPHLSRPGLNPGYGFQPDKRAGLQSSPLILCVEFEQINRAAYWDYRREKVLVKSSKRLKRITWKFLKTLAFHSRGENKDADDLFYLLRIYGRGVSDVTAQFRPFLPDVSSEKPARDGHFKIGHLRDAQAQWPVHGASVCRHQRIKIAPRPEKLIVGTNAGVVSTTPIISKSNSPPEFR